MIWLLGTVRLMIAPSLLAWRTVQSALLPGAGFDFDSHNKGTFHSRLSGTIAQDFIWPQIPNSVTFRKMGIWEISSLSLIWPHCKKVGFSSVYQFTILLYTKSLTRYILHRDYVHIANTVSSIMRNVTIQSVVNRKLWECQHKEILFLLQGMGLHWDHNNYKGYICSRRTGTYNPNIRF